MFMIICLFLAEFSLLEWRSKYGLSLDGPLPPVYVNILLAYLGVSRYLQDTPCVQGTEWQNGNYFQLLSSLHLAESKALIFIPAKF